MIGSPLSTDEPMYNSSNSNHNHSRAGLTPPSYYYSPTISAVPYPTSSSTFMQSRRGGRRASMHSCSRSSSPLSSTSSASSSPDVFSSSNSSSSPAVYYNSQQPLMATFNTKATSSTPKRYKCTVCGKKFTRPSSLNTHMYSHTGEVNIRERKGVTRNGIIDLYNIETLQVSSGGMRSTFLGRKQLASSCKDSQQPHPNHEYSIVLFMT